MGNLVDDILSGAYDHGNTPRDNLLDDDDNVLEDIEHLNWTDKLNRIDVDDVDVE